MNDQHLFATIRAHLFTAVIGDVMDKRGLTRQFLPPEIRPLQSGMALVGRAMPVLVSDVEERDGAGDPFGVMFRALDELKPDEVYIAAGGSPRYALWGGLMSTRAIKLGSAGAVFDGFHRDTAEIRRLGFPVFSRGAYAQDQRGRGIAADYRCPITFDNGTRVCPGDVLVADADGVAVVPSENAGDIVREALAKVEAESDVRQMIEAGERTEVIFRKTGIM